MFCCCLIVNYGVALHRMCYTIVCIVPWHYPFVEHFKGHKIGMGFFGGLFLVQGFFWVLLEALGIFLGLDFWLHSIIPVTWNPEYPPGCCSSFFGPRFASCLISSFLFPTLQVVMVKPDYNWKYWRNCVILIKLYSWVLKLFKVWRPYVLLALNSRLVSPNSRKARTPRFCNLLHLFFCKPFPPYSVAL